MVCTRSGARGGFLDGIQFSAQYSFVRSRQLEGTFPGDAGTGTWPISALRVGQGWGWPPEEVWPYDGDAGSWPPVEPPGVDAAAKPYRTHRYQRVRTLAECRTVLGGLQQPVQVSLEITEKWFTAAGGRIPASSLTDPPIGSHCVLLIGYNDDKAEFLFQNSWGASWGDQGFGYIPYEVFEATWCEGWLMDLFGHERFSKPPSAIAERQWGIPEHGGGIFHAREFVTPEDERIGWTFATVRGGCIEVEELFVRPSFRGQGYGRRLIHSLEELAADSGGPLKIWISHADVGLQNLSIVQGLVQPLGLSIKPSGLRWAPLVASLGGEASPQQPLAAGVSSYPRPMKPLDYRFALATR
jgi:GNAT superfamily N-acetyltransferase